LTADFSTVVLGVSLFLNGGVVMALFYLLICLFIPWLTFQHAPHDLYLAYKMCWNNKIE